MGHCPVRQHRAHREGPNEACQASACICQQQCQAVLALDCRPTRGIIIGHLSQEEVDALNLCERA